MASMFGLWTGDIKDIGVHPHAMPLRQLLLLLLRINPARLTRMHATGATDRDANCALAGVAPVAVVLAQQLHFLAVVAVPLPTRTVQCVSAGAVGGAVHIGAIPVAGGASCRTSSGGCSVADGIGCWFFIADSLHRSMFWQLTFVPQLLHCLELWLLHWFSVSLALLPCILRDKHGVVSVYGVGG